MVTYAQINPGFLAAWTYISGRIVCQVCLQRPTELMAICPGCGCQVHRGCMGKCIPQRTVAGSYTMLRCCRSCGSD